MANITRMSKSVKEPVAQQLGIEVQPCRVSTMLRDVLSSEKYQYQTNELEEPEDSEHESKSTVTLSVGQTVGHAIAIVSDMLLAEMVKLTVSKLPEGQRTLRCEHFWTSEYEKMDMYPLIASVSFLESETKLYRTTPEVASKQSFIELKAAQEREYEKEHKEQKGMAQFNGDPIPECKLDSTLLKISVENAIKHAKTLYGKEYNISGALVLLFVELLTAFIHKLTGVMLTFIEVKDHRTVNDLSVIKAVKVIFRLYDRDKQFDKLLEYFKSKYEPYCAKRALRRSASKSSKEPKKLTLQQVEDKIASKAQVIENTRCLAEKKALDLQKLQALKAELENELKSTTSAVPVTA